MTPWSILGIAPTADVREIKRAYAKLVRKSPPDGDQAAFMRVREAYEEAMKAPTSVETEYDPHWYMGEFEKLRLESIKRTAEEMWRKYMRDMWT